MDDVARAEEALADAMAQAWRAACQDYAGDDNECMDRLAAMDALAAAREVTVSVPCPQCEGRGWVLGSAKKRWVVERMRLTCDAAGCSNGTVSRSALAVLMGEEQ